MSNSQRLLRRCVVIFAVVVIALYQGYCYINRLYYRDLARTEDLFNALVFFLEANEGRFPKNKEELLKCSWVTRVPPKCIVIAKRGPSDPTRIHGEPICNLSRFNVAWGVDLQSFGRRGTGEKGGDRKYLMTWPDRPNAKSNFSYTDAILKIHSELVARKSSQGRLQHSADSAHQEQATDVQVGVAEPAP